LQKQAWETKGALDLERGNLVGKLLGPLRAAKRQLWGQGATALVVWLSDRELELEASMSDAPPRDEVLAHLTCPLAEAARTCRALGYRACTNMDTLHERALPVCDGARERLADAPEVAP
jgi:hypothetical protein